MFEAAFESTIAYNPFLALQRITGWHTETLRHIKLVLVVRDGEKDAEKRIELPSLTLGVVIQGIDVSSPGIRTTPSLDSRMSAVEMLKNWQENRRLHLIDSVQRATSSIQYAHPDCRTVPATQLFLPPTWFTGLLGCPSFMGLSLYPSTLPYGFVMSQARGGDALCGAWAQLPDIG